VSDMNSYKRGAKMNLHSALVELMQKGRLVSLFSLHYSIQGVIDSTLPCFAAFRDQTANQLRDRFQPALTHSLVEEHVNRLIDSSLGSNWTRLYDSVRAGCHIARRC
jgi:phosphatidylinositol kinase/protein kinase (PI-3  family)